MRYYIVPAFTVNQKSHLAYWDRWNRVAYQVCMPNIPLRAELSPCLGGGGVRMVDWEILEAWDQYANEVTCPTCLERARVGKRLPREFPLGE